MSSVLILGATSAIAQETARLFARDGARLFLVARDAARLECVAADLRSRGAASVEVTAADLTDPAEQRSVVAAAAARLPAITHALIAHGVLPDQERALREPEYACATIDVNFLSPVGLALHLAPVLERQRHGCLAVIGSVAGDRVRQSNSIYGTAKGALEIFLTALRARLVTSGVRVLVIKPGFVDSPMTAHLRKGPLFATPRTVGAAIHRAMTGRARATLYVPGYWRLIMFVIRSLPGPVFRRLRF